MAEPHPLNGLTVERREGSRTIHVMHDERNGGESMHHIRLGFVEEPSREYQLHVAGEYLVGSKLDRVKGILQLALQEDPVNSPIIISALDFGYVAPPG